MEKTTLSLGIEVTVNAGYDEAIDRAKAALKAEGFGVLTEVDVKATMKQKLGVDFRRYVILGACNPPLAHRALSADLDVGLLLPCNVVVYEADDKRTVVSFVNPAAMAGMMDNPAFNSIAADATDRLERAAAALRG